MKKYLALGFVLLALVAIPVFAQSTITIEQIIQALMANPTLLQQVRTLLFARNNNMIAPQTITITTPTLCAKADTNGDGVVNTADYSFIQGYIGCNVNLGSTYCVKSDVNSDGLVNTSDYVSIRGQIGCSSGTTIAAITVSGSLGVSGVTLAVGDNNRVGCSVFGSVYFCTVPQGVSTMITPSKSGWSFTPSYRFVSNPHSNPDKDFVAVQTSTTTPSITILAPNGGEVFQQGQQHTIKWQGDNIPADGLIGLAFEDSQTVNTYVFTDATNTGSKNATVPNVTSGSYRARIFCTSGGYGSDRPCGYPNSTQDYSDSYFTITSATTTISLPDLTVEDISLSGAAIVARVCNRGVGGASNFYGSFYDGAWQPAPSHPGFYFNSLAPGNCGEARAGSELITNYGNTVTFKVDYDNRIAESNETNNQLTKVFGSATTTATTTVNAGTTWQMGAALESLRNLLNHWR